MPQINEPSESRELTPVQMFWGQKESFKDFSLNVKPSDAAEEVKEVEEAITPAPKDSSARLPATSEESPPINAPAKLEIPVLPGQFPLPTELLEAAVKESGKHSESSEDEPQKESEAKPDPEPSSSDSSSETSPGKSTPPASAVPPPVV